jgi:hypothetical protein
MICNPITRTQPRLLSRSQDSQFELRDISSPDISSPDIRATPRGVMVPPLGQSTTRAIKPMLRTIAHSAMRTYPRRIENKRCHEVFTIWMRQETMRSRSSIAAPAIVTALMTSRLMGLRQSTTRSRGLGPVAAQPAYCRCQSGADQHWVGLGRDPNKSLALPAAAISARTDLRLHTLKGLRP